MPLLTLHMVPAEDWAKIEGSYRPASLDREGFVHCINGYEVLAEVGNYSYRVDPRPYVILTIDLTANAAPWRYDDPEERFPHIFGPVDHSAVVQVEPFPRSSDGAFQAPSGGQST